MRTVEQTISGVLGIDEGAITDSVTPADIKEWDSFNGLLVVTELEKEFKVTFSLEEVISIKTVGDIKKVLKKHGVNAYAK
ncbi:MAG: acyl carrier protein [bacterium]|nr:acyl carrier protein [bacterium]